MPVVEPPLAVALRVGGRVVLGFHVHKYDGLTFGAAELVLGPASSAVHLGVKRPLPELFQTVCKSVFGEVAPLDASLEVGFRSALPDELLGGQRADGSDIATTYPNRGRECTAPFSPRLGTREVECAGLEGWRDEEPLVWYLLSLLRPWFESALSPAESERRINSYRGSMSHNQRHAQSRLLHKHKHKQQDSTSAIGLQHSGHNRPAWQAWALLGYRLQPGGGAISRRGDCTPKEGLAAVAARERLPWPVESWPSEEVMDCFLSPVDAGTTAALARSAAARADATASSKSSRTMKPRAGEVAWLLSAAEPRLVLVLGHACWGGGTEKGGLALKRLPSTGEAADRGLPPLSAPEQLQPDLTVPVTHVMPFAKLLDMEWCRPRGSRPIATRLTGGDDADAELRGSLKDAIRAYLSGEAEQDQLGMGAWLADGISIKPEEYETGGEWTHLRALAGIDVLVSRRYAVWRGEMLHFPGEVVSAILKEEPLPWEAEAGGPGHEGEREEGEGADAGSPIRDRRAEARADRLRDEEVAAFEAEARREQAAAGERGAAEVAGRIPAGVVMHGASAPGASSSSATGSTLPTAPLGGGSNPPGPGSKRKLETGSGEESEAARLCRADLRAAEAGLAREVVVPLGHRAAVVEGLRRVLSGSKPPPDPEAYWASKGPGGRFPFPEHLSAMRAELAAEEATKRGHA